GSPARPAARPRTGSAYGTAAPPGRSPPPRRGRRRRGRADGANRARSAADPVARRTGTHRRSAAAARALPTDAPRRALFWRGEPSVRGAPAGDGLRDQRRGRVPWFTSPDRAPAPPAPAS